MALIKCEECGESISSSAKVCPHCGIKINLQTCPECSAKLNGDEINCPECGYPVGKKSASNIITENLDKITGAQSKNYEKYKYFKIYPCTCILWVNIFNIWSSFI